MITSILPGMTPMRDIKKISDGDRLFYELGYKRYLEGGYGENWVRTGQFKEITDVKEYVEEEPLLTNIEFLEHHNFMLMKKPIYIGLIQDERNDHYTIGYSETSDLEKLKQWKEEMEGCSNVVGCKILRVEEV
jgi:hypothetical protein